MLPLIEERRSEIAALCRRFGVRRLAVFGSAARGTDFDPQRSDVDFIVEFEHPDASFSDFLALRDALAAAVAGRWISSWREASAIRSSGRVSSGRWSPFMERDPRAYLWEARNSADAIAEFVAGKGLDEYLSDRMLRAAAERQFEIVGEALRQLEKTAPDLARELPELPKAVAFRNILIHGYTTIDHPTVWRMVQESLPALRVRLAELLDRLGST